MTTKAQVNKAFRDLRKAGYIARQNFWCCMSCGFSAMQQKYPDAKKVVFYHNQDNEAWDKDTKTLTDRLYLAWDGDGAEIVDILEKAGLEVIWNGTEGMRIGILP